MELFKLMQQLLDSQNALHQEIKTFGADIARVTFDSNIHDEEDCLTNDEVVDHPVTEDSDVQVGGDYSITDEVDEETSPTAASTLTTKLEESPQLVETQVLTTPPQLEVTPVMPLSSSISTTQRDVSKFSISPPHKASDYYRKAPMNEEIIDGISLENLFSCNEAIDLLPENSCKLPTLELIPDLIPLPIGHVTEEERIMNGPRVENMETDHLQGMLIKDLVPEEQHISLPIATCQSPGKNNSTWELKQKRVELYSAEYQIVPLTSHPNMLPVEFNIKFIKDHLHPERELVGAFTPCYADMIKYQVVEKMPKSLDQFVEKQFFGEVYYSLWDEPSWGKRGFDDPFGSYPHTKAKRCKKLLDSYMPTLHPNVFDDESKPCSPKVKMKQILINVTEWVSMRSEEPKEEKDPPWKKQRVGRYLVAEPERTPHPLPAPPPLPDPPPLPTLSLK